MPSRRARPRRARCRRARVPMSRAPSMYMCPTESARPIGAGAGSWRRPTKPSDSAESDSVKASSAMRCAKPKQVRPMPPILPARAPPFFHSRGNPYPRPTDLRPHDVAFGLRARCNACRREWIGTGVPPGLQSRSGFVNSGAGGFDSHALPPLHHQALRRAGPGKPCPGARAGRPRAIRPPSAGCPLRLRAGPRCRN